MIAPDPDTWGQRSTVRDAASGRAKAAPATIPVSSNGRDRPRSGRGHYLPLEALHRSPTRLKMGWRLSKRANFLSAHWGKPKDARRSERLAKGTLASPSAAIA